MRIKVLRNVGKKDTQPKSSDYPGSLELPVKSDGKPYKEGEVIDVDDDDAEKFIRCGVGEPLESQRKNVKTPEPEPTKPQETGKK